MKNITEMTVKEMTAEVEQAIERIIAIQRHLSFVPEYQEKATPEECLGMMLSHHFEWNGMRILKTAYEGLEDANYSSEASVLELLLNDEKAPILARKIFEENG